MECVGCSNNTIRAALTPKFIDRENLVEVLNYRMTSPDFYMVPPVPLSGYPHVVEYAPADCKDFILHQIEVRTCSQKHIALSRICKGVINYRKKLSDFMFVYSLFDG